MDKHADPCPHCFDSKDHDNEEEIYFPFLLEHGGKIPEDRIADDHKSLVDELTAINDLAAVVVQKKGLKCDDKIAQLKAKIPIFITDMKEHLKEEETFAPKAIREAGITEQENGECIGKLMQAGGILGLHTELPGVLIWTKHWGTDEYYESFLKEVPPPMIALANDIFIPNLKNKFHAQRDAPTMTEKPEWTEVPFDPSMLPPPPPQE
mmetsp:Transcript_19809/g.54589  ORF Transcript_19809/g.54589 Transcript_19809/m.54589 type:complete len:208 (+) Transcript_19809:63-686(+)